MGLGVLRRTFFPFRLNVFCGDDSERSWEQLLIDVQDSAKCSGGMGISRSRVGMLDRSLWETIWSSSQDMALYLWCQCLSNIVRTTKSLEQEYKDLRIGKSGCRSTRF